MSVKIRDLMILSSRNLPGCEMVRMGSAVVHCEGFELELVYAELDHRRTTQSEKKTKKKDVNISSVNFWPEDSPL